jgi:hypothetical protein
VRRALREPSVMLTVPRDDIARDLVLVHELHRGTSLSSNGGR